ncbi:MAG: hypothetical protein AAF546_11035 [Verrucomicrobiota bacterium]
MIDYLIENKEWIFSGIGVTIIGIFFAFKSKSEPTQTTQESTNTSQNNVTNNISISQSPQPKTTIEEQVETECGEDNLQSLKDSTRILFIDDDTSFQVARILKSAGWVHTSLIKDVKSLDDEKIVSSKIIFVDIQGVGKKLAFTDEGLGLAKALKQKYSEKFVILYSAETQGNRFHEALKITDDALAKNADPYEFEQIVERFSCK